MTDVTLTLTRALNLASSAYRAGKYAEAERISQKIVDAQPDHFDALHLLALIQSALGKAAAALVSYDRALAVRPDTAEALSNRGNTLRQLNRLDDALASFDRALAARPRHAGALSNRGNVLHELRRFDDALASYDRALALQPDHAEALSNRGNVLCALERFEDALASHDRALAVRPDYVEAHSNRSNVLYELKRFDEALASCDRALALRPDYAAAHSNRGMILYRLDRFEEALASYDRALAARPDYAEALSNRGNALRQLKRFAEALQSYDRALALRPNLAEAHFNQALCRMQLGDFARGLEQYEWRRETEQSGKAMRAFPQPLWCGADEIAGKTILLHAEQGFGDTIQFCRYVPLVARRGARVVLEVQAPLRDLMGGLGGAAHIVGGGESLPAFDLHCPLLSLPLAFGTRLESIPSATPYLHASVQSATNWKERLGAGLRPKIGLVWSGLPLHRHDRHRSMRLRSFIPLLDVDATFVSLQKDVRAEDAAVLQERTDILRFGDELKDFSDTAALIANLDLVITVDTAVAHLAAALGKPVWVLLSFMPDWRWLLDRDDSPWYPTARLFRQDLSRTWDRVIARVRDGLDAFLRHRA